MKSSASTALVLYTSTEVRSAIRSLFRDQTAERIVISAFVGDGADAYLPFPKGLRLICSPTPGATNPNALRLLMRKGVFVEFVDSLHMKVYWSKNRGAVVTSANLSTNAMGAGGLKEAGVLLGPNKLDKLDIERMLGHLKRRPAKPELRALDQLHKDFYKRNGWTGNKRPKPGYAEWFVSSARARWKIFFYATKADDLSMAAKQSTRKEFNKAPHDWIWSRLRRVRENDWILCGFTARGRLQELSWLFADRVFAVPRLDKNYCPDYPYEVLQIHGAKHYPPPPFSANKQFRNALGQILRDRISKETDTPYELRPMELRRIYESLA